MKNCLLICCFGLLLFPLSAQLSFGIKAGATIATVNERPQLADLANRENITGLAAGFFLEFGGNSLLGLRPELLFRQKGYQYSFPDLDSLYSEQFNYLDLPVVLRLHLGPQNLRLYAEGGASLGYLLNGVRTYTENGREIEEDIDTSDDYDATGRREVSIDFGGVLGAGLEAKIGPGRLHLGGRYNIDLNDFYDFEGQAPPDWEALRWRSLDVTLGYSITL